MFFSKGPSTNQRTTQRATQWATQRARMVDQQLRSRGIHSETVLRVMGEIPRERFLPPGREDQAYRDQALPLSLGQTISQPYMVAAMTEALCLQPTDRVLEIGTGSGYQTTVLARMASEVFSVERIPELALGAGDLLQELEVGNVRLEVGDGTLGWPSEAPYDAILVTAGAPKVPDPLLDQLVSEGGRLVVPVGDRAIQDLVRVTRTGDSYRSEKLLACRFVPLLGAEGWDTP